MMQKMCEVHDCEKFQLKNARWRTAAILNIEKLQYLRAMQNGFLKRIAVRRLGFLKLVFNGRRT